MGISKLGAHALRTGTLVSYVPLDKSGPRKDLQAAAKINFEGQRVYVRLLGSNCVGSVLANRVVQSNATVQPVCYALLVLLSLNWLIISATV